MGGHEGEEQEYMHQKIYLFNTFFNRFFPIKDSKSYNKILDACRELLQFAGMASDMELVKACRTFLEAFDDYTSNNKREDMKKLEKNVWDAYIEITRLGGKYFAQVLKSSNKADNTDIKKYIEQMAYGVNTVIGLINEKEWKKAKERFNGLTDNLHESLMSLFEKHDIISIMTASAKAIDKKESVKALELLKGLKTRLLEAAGIKNTEVAQTVDKK